MDCKAWTIWNFPPFNWIDPQNKRSLIEFSGKLSSCFQVSVNTRYFNYMMISIERVCKQPERRQRLHTREAPCSCLAFAFSFQDEQHFPKAHQQGQGPWSCYLDFRGWLLPVPAFPSSAYLLLELIPQGSNSLFLTIQTIFHTKHRLLVPRPQNYMEALTKMCWLRKICWSEVKKQLPLAFCPAPISSSRHLSPNPCKWEVESAGEGMLEFMSGMCSLLRTGAII